MPSSVAVQNTAEYYHFTQWNMINNNGLVVVYWGGKETKKGEKIKTFLGVTVIK